MNTTDNTILMMCTRFHSMIFRRRRFALILSLYLTLVSMTVSAAPAVVVSIPPIHSLVSSVMQGIAQPVLLVPGGQSPHAISLKPSLVRELSNADVLVWISPEFEMGLKKTGVPAKRN